MQNCVIYVNGVTSKEMVNDGGMLAGFITAQGRESEQDTSGFVFNNCVIKGDGKAFLGRAYRGHSRVVFYGTKMSNVIVPQGWDAWYYKGQEYVMLLLFCFYMCVHLLHIWQTYSNDNIELQKKNSGINLHLLK